MALRNILPAFDCQPATRSTTIISISGWQARFGRWSSRASSISLHFNPIHVVLDGEYVWNTAFDRGAMAAVAVNNFGGTSSGALGSYNGGDMGWLLRLTVGDPQILHRWIGA